jgi:hypothetical protein
MPERVLSVRQLNRATLARQLLLDRAELGVPQTLERLVGLQAQMAQPPYVGLWTRLSGFQRADLAALITDRRVVKATLMRSTLHLCTTEDYLHLRAVLQPVLTSAFMGIAKRRQGENLDIAQLIALAREFLTGGPRSFAEISDMLAERMPQYDVGLLRYGVRTHVPLIQVPTDTRWSYPGNPQFTPADDWLGQTIPTEGDLATLIRRYLAAFGPASVTDLQNWSGLSKLKDAVHALRAELVTYRDERKRELFDLPDQPLPDAETPAPPRFMPEFDNLLLGHDNRTRIIADEHKPRVYLPGLRVAATFLIDGFVAGIWQVAKKAGVAALTLEPFAPLSPAELSGLNDEGERLLRFIEPDARAYAVQVAEQHPPTY